MLPGLVNGKPHYKQVHGKNGIWTNRYGRWMIGTEKRKGGSRVNRLFITTFIFSDYFVENCCLRSLRSQCTMECTTGSQSGPLFVNF